MKIRISIMANLFAMLILVLSSCTNDKTELPIPEETKGSMLVKFEHSFNGTDFELNSTDYFKNLNQDSLKFTKLYYYISNIKLKRTDGSIWTQPDSYYLINYGEAQAGVNAITLNDIPSGDYTDMTFTIGVDSTKNVSGAQTGALDPANGMFWSWNNGYIFLKAEGSFRNVNSGMFMLHAGGFKNSDNTNALRTKTFNFGPLPVTVNPNTKPQAHYLVDVYKIFSGPGITINVATAPVLMMPGASAVNMSKNYIEMFKLDHVHN